MKPSRTPNRFLRKHSLSLTALGVVVLLIALYCRSNPSTHLGSFFGNAIADWTGVFVTILMTKHLYEKGSSESKQPKGKLPSAVMEFLREHSLTVFPSDYGHRLGGGIPGHGPRQQVGTSRRQHRFRVDTDPRTRPDDQAADRSGLQRRLRALTPGGHVRRIDKSPPVGG